MWSAVSCRAAEADIPCSPKIVMTAPILLGGFGA